MAVDLEPEDVRGGDGGDQENGCGACGAPLLEKVDARAGRVWWCCSGGCGEFELTPAMVAKLYPEIGT